MPSINWGDTRASSSLSVPIGEENVDSEANFTSFLATLNAIATMYGKSGDCLYSPTHP